MSDSGKLDRLYRELHQELTEHLLPFWAGRALDERLGGFVGQMTQEGVVVPDAVKGAVLNARILWTFSAACRLLGEEGYRRMADRAYEYMETRFRDVEYGGVFWSLDSHGHLLDTRKQTYAQAFALYGLTEYHRAAGHAGAREWSIKLFQTIERHCYDGKHGGYLEAFGRAWDALDDVRLSEKDMNAPKSMNTHLHVLEAYTNLHRIWPDSLLKRRLAGLVELFLNVIIDPVTRHQRLFFSEDWQPVSDTVSYGHDIEASWLLLEAADELANPELRSRARDAALELARATQEEGQDADGGLFNEQHSDGRIDTDKHWWPQAEAIVGFLNAYQETGEDGFLDAAAAAWDFTKRRMIDTEQGEWFGRVSREGVVYPGEDKIGLWKCPYHNGRVCMEVMARAEHAGAARP